MFQWDFHHFSLANAFCFSVYTTKIETRGCPRGGGYTEFCLLYRLRLFLELKILNFTFCFLFGGKMTILWGIGHLQVFYWVTFNTDFLAHLSKAQD